MRFLADQDVWAATLRRLEAWGHDVVPVAEIGYADAGDAELLAVAAERERVLITRDRDFGSLVFVEGFTTGVIYLRILPTTQQAVHEELGRVTRRYTEEQLRRAFVVVEPGRHRFRRLDA